MANVFIYVYILSVHISRHSGHVFKLLQLIYIQAFDK